MKKDDLVEVAKLMFKMSKIDFKKIKKIKKIDENGVLGIAMYVNSRGILISKYQMYYFTNSSYMNEPYFSLRKRNETILLDITAQNKTAF